MRIDTTMIHPRLVEKLNQLVKVCKDNGITIEFSSGYRSFAEQDKLYAQGRTEPGMKVTNARGGYSQHNWGIAADFFLDMDVDGDGSKSDDAFNNNTALFDKVGRLAGTVGLGWGGNWTSPVDRPHLYLPDWGSTPTPLRNKYGTYEQFKATWPGGGSASGSIDADYPLERGDRGSNVTWAQGRLNVHGANLAVDGIFGAATESATRTFQAAHGLDADGVIGSKTKAALEQDPAGTGDTYTIKPGDTLSGIAAAHGTTVDALAALNGISDPDKINAGDTIKISGTASDPAPAGDDWIRQLQHQLNVQFSAGLAEDGIAGPKTLAACITCRPGARGEITRLIQSKVGTTADGIWGNNTTAAVKAYQSTHGLTADGIVGKNTWRAMLGL